MTDFEKTVKEVLKNIEEFDTNYCKNCTFANRIKMGKSKDEISAKNTVIKGYKNEKNK